MRKCSSAPDVLALQERSAGSSQQPRQSASRTFGSVQSSRLKPRGHESGSNSHAQGPEAGPKLGTSLARQTSTVHSPRSTAARTFMSLTPPFLPSDLLQEADEIAEVSELKGITAAECFEIYGIPSSAPSTNDAAAAAAASWTQLVSDREGLASCLATPSTGVEERSLGEALNEHLRNYSAEQARNAEERVEDELASLKEARDGVTAATGRAQQIGSRRRRSIDIFQSEDEECPTQPRPPSPDGHAYLTSLHGSMDDDRNKIPWHGGKQDELHKVYAPAFLVPEDESARHGMRLVEDDTQHLQALSPNHAAEASETACPVCQSGHPAQPPGVQKDQRTVESQPATQVIPSAELQDQQPRPTFRNNIVPLPSRLRDRQQ